MNENKYLTVPEAAAELGIQQRSVHSQLSKGNIPYKVIVGRKVILRAEIEAYKARTQPDGEPKAGRPRKQPAN